MLFSIKLTDKMIVTKISFKKELDTDTCVYYPKIIISFNGKGFPYQLTIYPGGYMTKFLFNNGLNYVYLKGRKPETLRKNFKYCVDRLEEIFKNHGLL